MKKQNSLPGEILEQHRRDIDAALMKLGVRRLAEGVYAIP